MNFALNILINYTTLPVILIIGILVAIDDYKEGKIKNKRILLGIYLGLIYYALMVAITIFGVYKIDKLLPFLNKYELSYLYFSKDYYLSVILNTLVAFIFGFVLWHFKLWAGGDAKLFTLYVFLLPLNFYSNWYFKYWPALALLINICLPIFVYLLIKMLFYPIQLGWSYLKNPALLKEYYQKYKVDNKIDKTKIREYFNTGVSFLVILIFFQLLRTRVNEFLNPYLGQMVTFSYFFMGFVIFKPLRALLQKWVLIVFSLVLLYFLFGFIYFRAVVYSELHKLFALQMIFMLSYFYIFKYGRALGLFLYNSAEVKMIPIAELSSNVYINKDYIRQIMGSRTNLNDFKNSLDSVLEEEDKDSLFELIKQKIDKTSKERQQYQIISLFTHFRLDALPNLIKTIYLHKKKRESEKLFLEKILPKLSEQQKRELNNILNNTDEVKEFLKTVRGKLTDEQAEKLKAMIDQRNEEIKAQGLVPIDKIILHKTFSFAPFMLLGVLITIITRSSLIGLIYQYILHK